MNQSVIVTVTKERLYMDAQKRSDYLLLIQARLYGQSGNIADKAARLNLSPQTVNGLISGKANGFSLAQLVAVARKAGVTARL